MKLLTKALIKKLPQVGFGANNTREDLVFHVKLFHPSSNWTWYISEYDEKTGECFGLVDGFEQELGYFSLPELQSVRVHGLGIERDLYFSSTKYPDLKL